MKNEFAIGVHWTNKKDGTFYVLFSDGTWEAYSLAVDGVIIIAYRSYLNLKVCIQQKMSKKQVDKYINSKVKMLKRVAEES